jgi:hypothetical protein
LTFRRLIGLGLLQNFLKIGASGLMGTSFFVRHQEIRQIVQFVNFHAPPSADIYLLASHFANSMPKF